MNKLVKGCSGNKHLGISAHVVPIAKVWKVYWKILLMIMFNVGVVIGKRRVMCYVFSYGNYFDPFVFKFLSLALFFSRANFEERIQLSCKSTGTSTGSSTVPVLTVDVDVECPVEYKKYKSKYKY